MHFTTKAFLLLILITPLRAEDPVMLGLKGALNSLSPVPASTARQAEATATSILRPYLKPTRGGFHCRTRNSWIEVRNLRIKRVTLGVVSQADRANGITDMLTVAFDADMHRTQKSDQPWSKWVNGKPLYIPSGIRVQRKNGKWSSPTPLLTLLQPCNDQPISIPGTQKATNPTRQATFFPTTPSTTSRSSKPIRTPAFPPESLPRSSPSRSPQPLKAHSIVDSFLAGFVKPGFVLLLAVAILAAALGLGKKRRKRRRQAPALPTRASSPPPLPPQPRQAETDSLELFTRRETLMTEAEQKFFAVLQALVTPSYLISSKVRLADLFDVLDAPGRQAAFNKICSKHIDFVLTEPGTSRILCGIELDDRSHQLPERIERDRFVNRLFATQGVPLLRVPWARHYDPEALRQSLTRHLGQSLAA